MQGPQSTDALVGALDPLRERQHLFLRRAMLKVAGPFPLAGAAHWSNDWHAYRPCPFPHLHMGLDLLADRGTPIVAVANARVTELVNDPQSAGLGVEITDGGGIRYCYFHMERRAAGLRVGLRVHGGEVLGFVGNTGNAAGGPTHLHFEVRPHGVPVPPKPYVDRWLLQAEAKARRLVQRAIARGRAEHVTLRAWPIPSPLNPLRELAFQAAPAKTIRPAPHGARAATSWGALLTGEGSRASGPIVVLVTMTLVPPAIRLLLRRRRKQGALRA